MRIPRKRTAVAVVAVGAVIAVGVGLSAWSVTGSGNGAAKATTASAITLADATGVTSADLYPGATGNLKLRATNPPGLSRPRLCAIDRLRQRHGHVGQGRRVRRLDRRQRHEPDGPDPRSRRRRDSHAHRAEHGFDEQRLRQLVPGRRLHGSRQPHRRQQRVAPHAPALGRRRLCARGPARRRACPVSRHAHDGAAGAISAERQRRAPRALPGRPEAAAGRRAEQPRVPHPGRLAQRPGRKREARLQPQVSQGRALPRFARGSPARAQEGEAAGDDAA